MNPSKAFKQRARLAIADAALQTALDNNAAIRRGAWGPAFASLPDADQLRKQAGDIRRDVVKNMRDYVEQFINHLSANHIQVHLASSAEEAQAYVLEIARTLSPQYAVKSKSMLTEEIGLNEAFLAAGIRPVETDLGEYIVQLRGEKPTHIITPAVHLRREQIAETFHQQLKVPYSTDIESMTAAAREHLRREFLGAPLAVTGVNFGVASTGTLCLLENEGNIRMAATLAPTHIAVMGLERLVPDYQSLAVMLQVLPRAATGQTLTSYVSWINTPAGPDDMEGPGERHLVLVDNGRLDMADSLLADALLCIRCGACLNACPVFQEIGGAAYGSVYPGPIGALVSPSLFGVADFGHLAKASTLCGACTDACPVGIDFNQLLQRRRVEYTQTVRQPFWLGMGLRAYTRAATSAARFQRLQAWAARLNTLLPHKRGWLPWLPGPLSAWTKHRHFPTPAKRPFRERWADLKPAAHQDAASPDHHEISPGGYPASSSPVIDLLDSFTTRLEAVGGEYRHSKLQDLARDILAICKEIKAESLLVSPLEMLRFESVLKELEFSGVQLVTPELPAGADERNARLAGYADVPVGLTIAAAGLADTGTVVQPGGPGRSMLASLLPEVHLAVLSLDDLYASMSAWLESGGGLQAHESPNLAFITGPSRTADIEMTLTIGVHGPRRVVVLGVD